MENAMSFSVQKKLQKYEKHIVDCVRYMYSYIYKKTMQCSMYTLTLPK